MKAKDYFEKYREPMTSHDDTVANKAISDFIIELNGETQQLLNARHAKSNAALAGVLSEINQKYNATMSLFEKNYGAAPMVKDGFMIFWVREMPQLKTVMGSRLPAGAR